MRDHRWTRATVAFLPELRPAWWVARGWLLVWLLAEATSGDDRSFPLPELLGNAFVGLLVTVPVIAWSVRLGRDPSPPRWRWLVNACAVVGALFALDAATADGDAVRYVPVETSPPAFAPDASPLRLWRDDGTPVTDLDAYGPDGRPTDQVVIVDQDGLPYGIGADPAPPSIPRDVWPTSDARPGAPTTAPPDPTAATTVPATAPTSVPAS